MSGCCVLMCVCEGRVVMLMCFVFRWVVIFVVVSLVFLVVSVCVICFWF